MFYVTHRLAQYFVKKYTIKKNTDFKKLIKTVGAKKAIVYNMKEMLLHGKFVNYNGSPFTSDDA